MTNDEMSRTNSCDAFVSTNFAMNATMASILILAIATCFVRAAEPRAQLQSWLRACDLSQRDDENCRNSSCLLALKHLAHPETRRAYQDLGMGSTSDLNVYSRLYHVCQLQSRDFTTSTEPRVMTKNWTTNLIALKRYRDIHGHVRVPRSFIVPSDVRWPMETHGVKLGKAVDNLRQRKDSLSPQQIHALEALGFDWGASRDHRWRKKLVALTTFKDIHGHVRVPHTFVVPNNDPRWPFEMHGMKLGSVVDHLRQLKGHLSQHQLHALDALGFDWAFSRHDNWEKNILALTTYEEIYGHMRVPRNFVVPTNDRMWPEGTHGMKLGNLVNRLRLKRNSLSQHQIDCLNFFGFEWTLKTKKVQAIDSHIR